MAWPTKTDFVDGDVLSASQMNNIGTNLNLFNPTSATAGQVLVANGAGSVSYGAGGGLTQIATGSMSGTTTVISGIPATYKHLMLLVRNVTLASGTGSFTVVPNNTSSYFWGHVSYSPSTAATTTAASTATWNTNPTYATNFASPATFVFTFYDYAQTGSETKLATWDFAGQRSGVYPVTQAVGQTFPQNPPGTPVAISSLTIGNSAAGTFTGGTYFLWGIS